MAIEDNMTLYTQMYNELFGTDTVSDINDTVKDLIHTVHRNIEYFTSEGYIGGFTITEGSDTYYTIEEVFVFITYILSSKEHLLDDETKSYIEVQLPLILQHTHKYEFTDIFKSYDIPTYFKENFARSIDYSYVVYSGPTHKLYDCLMPDTISVFNAEYRVFDVYNDMDVKFKEDEDPDNLDSEPKEIILKLYQLYYKFLNADTFCSRWTYDSPRYDAKHARIRYFKVVWKMYLAIDDSQKEHFYQEVVKKFEYINWTTMSRKFNPYDMAFKEKYDYLIDYDFAYKYHPILKLQKKDTESDKSD